MIDAHQVAAWSGLSTASIYKFSNDGRFLKPSLHIGRNVRWYKNELGRWKAAGFPPMPK
jgi:predicted DNA-binding transcriptional regulator AlpA